MKLLVGSVKELFSMLSEDLPMAYWETISRTSYSSGIPITRYTIRVTAQIKLEHAATLVEVTLPCGAHSGETYDDIDKTGKEKVTQYKQKLQAEIAALAADHSVELRSGILTADPIETLHGVVKNKEEALK